MHANASVAVVVMRLVGTNLQGCGEEIVVMPRWSTGKGVDGLTTCRLGPHRGALQKGMVLILLVNSNAHLLSAVHNVRLHLSQLLRETWIYQLYYYTVHLHVPTNYMDPLLHPHYAKKEAQAVNLAFSSQVSQDHKGEISSSTC
jgi:hypothetical protein